MNADYLLFYHIGTLNYYFWNGDYPINVSQQGTPWHPQAELTDQEIEAITSVIGNRKRTFSIKGRGEFHVVEKDKFITE